MESATILDNDADIAEELVSLKLRLAQSNDTSIESPASIQLDETSSPLHRLPYR